jgi:hypothetical protein
MEPPPPPQQPMNVTRSFGLAIQRTKNMLFLPFDIGVWLRMGFIIFLASLANSGGGGGGGGVPGDMPPDALQDAKAFIMENMALVITLAVLIALLITGVACLILWIGSRGQMMLIRAVATNEPYIGRNWQETARQANSVWLFRMAVWVMAALLFVPLFVIIVIMALPLADGGDVNVTAIILSLIPVGLAILAVALVTLCIHLLLTAFVMPLMYKDNTLCMEGWRRFRAMSRGNLGPILLFFLIRLGYTIAFRMVSFVFGCVTLCIGFLPFVHHTIFAPFYIFDRAYALYTIESLGPEFQIFATDNPELLDTPPPQ